MKCKNCGEEIGVAHTCWKCGTKQFDEKEGPESLGKDASTIGEESEQRRFCRECGAELGEDGVCPKCGTERISSPTVDGDDECVVRDPEQEEADNKKHRRRVIITSLGTAAVLLAAIVGVVWYGIDTALHWEKVDDPGTMIEQRTGYYIVTMDDDPVCYVGQDWTDCINAYIAEYNGACTLPMPPEDGGSSRFGAAASTDGGIYHQAALRRYNSQGTNRTLCNRYSEMISDMQAEDRPGYYVASLGSWGHLNARPETERVRVGYESHEAVCYYGFLGECPEDDEDK